MATKRAAIYARVSTAEQVDGTSLASQQAACRAYIAAQGWAEASSYIDEGVSGAKATRPALDRLLAAVRAATVEVVVVAKLDRIGRSMRHLAALLGELDDRDVALVSVSEAFDSSTPSGRLQRNMLGSFAEFEREQIRDRMATGRDAAIRAGQWVSPDAPYGYRVVGDGPNRRLEIEPDEAAALKAAIELLVDGRHTTGQIAKKLNAAGHRPRLSPRWSGNSLRTLLTTADCISGTWTWRHPRHGYRNPPITVAIPAIIDPATHQRLRDRLAATSERQVRNPGRYLLAGRICTPHGTLMYGLANSARLYRCSDVFATNAPPGGRTCDCRTVRAQPAEDAVWAEVAALLADPGRLLAMSGLQLARHATTVDESSHDLAAINRRIARLERAAGDRLSRLLADGLDPAVAAQAARNLTDELAAARRHRDQVTAWAAANAEHHTRAGRLYDLARQAEAILPGADQTTKRRILELLDVQVHVQGWDPCATCSGIGYLARSSQPQRQHHTDPTLRQAGYDNSCPDCHRHRYTPRLLIEGTIPETDLQNPPAVGDTTRWPFRLAGSA